MEKKTTAKRKLEDIIDVKKYYVSHGTKRLYEKKLIIRQNGQMSMNSTFLKATDERAFAVALSMDLSEVLMKPNCTEEVRFAKNGRTKDAELVKEIWKKKLSEQIEYIMKWNDENGAWVLSFHEPQVDEGYIVHEYKICIKDEAGKTVSNKNLINDYYVIDGDGKAQFHYDADVLEAGKTYTVTIRAESAYHFHSKPIELTFTAAE